MTRHVYEACFDGQTWRRMTAPNPSSILYAVLRRPGDAYTDQLGHRYRLRTMMVSDEEAA